MQKKKDTQLHKRITALVMSGVLLATSVPLVISPKVAAADPNDANWSPEPYFTEAARDEGAMAWFTNRGAITVKFPAANGGEVSYRNQKEQKKIKGYVFEISVLGQKNPDLTGAPEAVPGTTIYTTMVSAADVTQSKGEKAMMLTKVFKPGEIQLNGKPVTRDTDARLNIRITAVDDGNWFSEPMDTIVTDVPVFEYDEERYRPIDETNPDAMREIVQFEGGAIDTASNVTNFSGDGKHLEFVKDNPKQNAGAIIGSTNRPSKGIGFRLYEDIDKATPSTHIFETEWSREAWDFYGAEEVWFWFDCSDVCLNNVSLRLRSHEKLYTIWADGTFEKASDRKASKVVYSTKGFIEHASQSVKDELAKPVAEGGKRVLVQQRDGGWKEVNLAKGEQLNLDHFKGYVRVPIQFFCSEIDSKATARTDNLFAWKNDNGKAQIIIPETVVNPAGTSIDQATLMSTLQFKKLLWTSGTYNAPAPLIMNTNYGAQINKDRRLKYDTTAKAFTEDNRFFDEENVGVDGKPQIFKKKGSFKALEDIYSVGFSFDSTTSSKDHIFFFDSVMAYKPTEKYPANDLNGHISDGETVNSFYNQKKDRANILLDGIDNLIFAPTWTDYKEVEYISDMLKGFAKSFGEKADDPNSIFVDTDVNENHGMTKMATELGRLDTWKKYRAARDLCLKHGTMQEVDGALNIPANADMSDLVPDMIDILESLPPCEWMVNPTPEQKYEIIKLYQAYVMLNRTQLESLGAEERKACFEYFSILGKALGSMQNDFVVGEHLAEKPFLPFCDFETATIGMNQVVPRAEDDKDSYTSATDIRHTTGVNTVAGGPNLMNDKDEYLLSNPIPAASDIHSATAIMRSDGFMGSKAPRLYINTTTDTVNTLTVSRDGKDYKDLNDMKVHGGCGNNGYQLGKLAKAYDGSGGNEATEPPLSLIFYADFTELDQEFNLIVNIYTTDEQGNILKIRPNLGLFESDRKFFLLDSTTGKWEIAHCGETQFHFNSQKGANDKLDLNGYKGYVRIPLYHFKGGTLNTTKLDETAVWLNNIFAIQIGIGEMNASDSKNLQGKSFVIDNIGFTYSEKIYNPNGQNKPIDKTYEEVYNAKASPAVDFEYAVGQLDFFMANQAAHEQNVRDAITLYNALTKQQKSLPSVQNALVSLQRAAKWVNLDWTPGSAPTKLPGEAPRPNALDPYAEANKNTPVEELEKDKMTYKGTPLTKEAFVQYLDPSTGIFPDKARDDSVLNQKTDFNVRFPGYVVDPQDAKIKAVNYAALGFTGKEHVDRLLLLFEYGFSRLSWADQMRFQKAPALDKKTDIDIWNMTQEELNKLPDAKMFTEAWNVYKAAVRCRELDKTRTAVQEILLGNEQTAQPGVEKHSGIFSAYQDFNYIPEYSTTPEPLKRFAEIARYDSIADVYKKAFTQQPYYAKIASDTGAVIPSLKHVPQSVGLFLMNAKEYKFAQTTCLSGLLQLQKDYNTLNNQLTEILKNEQVGNAAAWEKGIRAVEDYMHLLPRFKNVGEVYTPIEHMLRKLPIVKTATAPETNSEKPADVDLYMTEKNAYQDKTVENSYQVTYAVDLSQIQADSESWLTFKPTTGVMKTAENLADEVAYTLTLNVNKVKRDAQGAAIGTPVSVANVTLDAKQIQAAAAGAPIGICKIDPNQYGKDVDGNRFVLEVEIASTMDQKAIPRNSFYGDDTFTIDVQTKKGAEFVPFVNAKNTDYPSSIAPRTYKIAYTQGDTFTVSFPAETSITWGDTKPADVSYNVTTHMADGSSVKVMVDDAKAGTATPYQLLLNGTDSSYLLNYTPAGFAVQDTFQGIVNNAKPKTACTLTIPQEEWKKGTGNYETTLTYTVEYTKDNSIPAPTPNQ